MLEPLYTSEEMREAEQRYPGYPDTVPELMDRAGGAVADAISRRFPGSKVVAVCGKGSNGGDGRIAAERLGGRVVEVGEDVPGDADVIVDALFGTGFHGEPRAEAARQIEQMNAAGSRVVAVDVPSGIDASTGEVAGAAVQAELTVTFHGPKVGLAVAPGRFHAGEVEVAGIGLEPLETEHRLVTREILGLVPRKGDRDNKYSAGAVLVVGGSPGMTGAACLAAEAAFRADAGYVTVCAPTESLSVIETRLLEAVKRPLENVLEAAERASALALGPGLGRSAESKALVRRLLEETSLPTVVDADALFELEPVKRAAPTVFTPHAGELGRLLGEDSAWVDAHRLESVRRAADRFGAVCLLKGADTLVAAPGAGVLVRSVSVPALATAGTGDVLTGIVAAFLAKGMEPRLAAAAAATAHGVAAQLAGKPTGMIASDVIDALPAALSGNPPTLE
jgi:ADP-dependent NAD(P)H-hydrate dehydratase / NAD(P)H-hydrate epimerase